MIAVADHLSAAKPTSLHTKIISDLHVGSLITVLIGGIEPSNKRLEPGERSNQCHGLSGRLLDSPRCCGNSLHRSSSNYYT